MKTWLLCKSNVAHQQIFARNAFDLRFEEMRLAPKTKYYLRYFTYDCGAMKHFEELNLLNRRNLPVRSLDWTFFPTLVEIYTWLDLVIAECPNVASGFDIGRSLDGRLIRGIKISFKPHKKAIFIESNIHGNESLASATVTYIIKELLFSKKHEIRAMAESLDWYIVPVLNVDDFVYPQEKKVRFRKPRSSSVDDFNSIAASRRKADFNYESHSGQYRFYPGPISSAVVFPESDLGTKSAIHYIKNSIPDGTVKVYIALGEFTERATKPWIRSSDVPDNYQQMMFVAKCFTEAVYTTLRVDWNLQTIAKALNIFADGKKSFVDMDKYVPICFNIELPNKDQDKKSHFQSAEEMILPVSKELLGGFAGMVEAVKKLVRANSVTNTVKAVLAFVYNCPSVNN
uniref:Peptidase M14 domain-containing protein n=1 Tax=Glossina pallidipes TaxID=7398 RepID=A0A1B0AEM1_GLOPL